MTDDVKPRRRHAHWRGERRAIMVRLDPALADAVVQISRDEHCSLSDAAGQLIASALGAKA